MIWARGKQLVLEGMLALAPGLYGLWEGRKGSAGATVTLPPSASQQRLLLIDHDFPEVDRDAGSRAIASFAVLLTEAGMEVVFWAATTSPSAAGRQWLSASGVQSLGRDETGPLDAWLASCPGFTSAVLSRPLVAAMYLPVVRRRIHGICLYYGHDIHYQRLESMRVTTELKNGGWERWLMRVVERRLWREADVVLYPSREEAQLVNAYRHDLALVANAQMFPLWTVRTGVHASGAVVTARKGLLFVGSRGHMPNVDGLDWFLAEVAPLLHDALGEDCVLTVVGSGMEKYQPPIAVGMEGLRILGWVDDAVLGACYDSARVVIAPLRYGGGVKGKVLEAISKGVPCVMTPAAAQGLDGIERILPVQGDAGQYADAIIRLITDDEAWCVASDGALRFLAERYDHHRFVAKLQELFAAA